MQTCILLLFAIIDLAVNAFYDLLTLLLTMLKWVVHAVYLNLTKFF